MIMPDVNVLVGAMRQDDPHHDLLDQWLAHAVSGDDELGLSVLVLAAVFRVMTHERFYVPDDGRIGVFSQIERLIEQPNVCLVFPTQRGWPMFLWLCRAVDARGNLVSDAQHAAIAIEHDATWVSLDRDFARFPGLKWVMPMVA
jgi:toxin-antitoxin system PIN domain toxin